MDRILPTETLMMTTEGFDVVQDCGSVPWILASSRRMRDFATIVERFFFIKLNTFSLSLMIGEAYSDVGNVIHCFAMS